MPSPLPERDSTAEPRLRADEEWAERRLEEEADTEEEMEPELMVEAAAAEPVDRTEGGLTCDRMLCKDPCSEGMSRGEWWY